MSKKEIDFKKLEPHKKLNVKKPENILDTEKAVQSIHTSPQEKERVKRVTIDLPFSIYLEVKQKIVQEEKTMRDYFINLANDDLKL